jgi:hypothetical protein
VLCLTKKKLSKHGRTTCRSCLYLSWRSIGRCLLLQRVRLRVYFKAVQTSYKLIGRSLRSILGMNHEQHVRKARAEVSTVRVVMLRRLGSVHVQTLGTIEFNHGLAWHIRQPYGQHGLILAVNSRTKPKVSVLIFFQLDKKYKS